MSNWNGVMVNFEILPYVFEMARMLNGGVNDYAMRYDEYEEYVRIFEDLSEDEKMNVVYRVRKRLDGNCKQLDNN